jgi:hypothetical protein
VHSMLVSELAAIYQFKNENTKFKVALRKWLNTQNFYSADELFMCKYKP